MVNLQDLIDGFDRICKVCGLSFGAHSYLRSKCPRHESQMDWDADDLTTFVDSGERGEIPDGTPSKRYQ